MATAKAKGSRYQTETGMIFNAEKWLHEFRKPNKFREMRVRIMEGTLEACALFHYILPNGELVSLGNETSVSEEARKTRLYNDTDDTLRKVRAEKPSDGHKTTVEVVNRDCLEEALRLKKLGLNPAVLNMASRRRPGGGYLSGAGAQEENLFRRSNYVQHLADPNRQFDQKRSWSYPLPEFSCVYSTNVLIFRSSEQTGYAFLPEPIPMSFLAVAAYANPKLSSNGNLTNQMAENTKRKIRTMLSVALLHSHDSLVLSALGCGAFRNPPRHMALLFRQVLGEVEFNNKFKHISFAILDDHNSNKGPGSGQGNYRPFCDVFGMPTAQSHI